VKNFRPFVRRLSILAAATLTGTAALLAVTAAPAHAHHSTVYGEAVCDTETGNWVVTWTVRNSMTNRSAVLIEASWTPSAHGVSNINVGSALPRKGQGVLTGQQIVPGSETSATLAVRGKWENNFVERRSGPTTVTFGGTCEEDKPLPNASFISACDGSVTVTLSNAADARKAAAFTVVGENNFSEARSVAKGDSTDVTVPAASAGDIKVLVGGREFAAYKWLEPPDCAPLQVAALSDCKTLTFSVENPAGNRPKEITVTSGDTTETLTLAAGETKEFTFPGAAGTTATVSLGQGDPVTITWEDPGNCNPPPPELPETGVKLSGLIGLGGALVLVGSALLFVLHRRRTGLHHS
jgi:LPXTG-motif cell wall-anchored protein